MDIDGLTARAIVERNRRSLTIREKLKSESPDLASLVTVSTLPPAEIQANIGNDETLIEYYYYGQDLMAFVVTRDRLEAIGLNGKHLIGEVEEFRKALEDPRSQQYQGLSRQLWQRLLQPVASLLINRKLVFVPHGVLHYVPFGALNNGHNDLLDLYSVSYLPSSSILKFLQERKGVNSQQLLVFGNPDLNDPRYDLRSAEEEALAISREFPQAKVLLRKEATKAAFKRIGPAFRYIHLATHGIFESDSPLSSGLLLAKEADDNGLLSVGELYSLSLNADLVTLSACETGLGKINHGDDLVGLSRGFLYSGSNSIIASLWRVDDEATSKLMTNFYQTLKKVDKREALRQAQLSTREKYPHPYYWAAFQLTGSVK